MLIQYPFSFFLAFFVLTATLAAWFGYQLAAWRIRRLQSRLEMMKIELSMLAPRRSEAVR